MRILNDIYREQRERCNGRIDSTPGNWVFGEPVDADTHAFPRTDANGRKMFMITQEGIMCENPDIGFEYPCFRKDTYWFVPRKICRKCQHYRKGGTDRLRYPHCQWTRERCGGNAGAARETLGMMNAAVERANEIIGG